MVAQHGYLAGKPDRPVHPDRAMPGFKRLRHLLAEGPELREGEGARAGQHARRQGRDVHVQHGAGPADRAVVQFNLKQIGIDVEIKLFDRVVQHEKTATRGEPFDLTLEGWGADYPDPANFINVLLDGRRIQADNNVNASYFNNPTYNAQMDAAYGAGRRRPHQRVRHPRPRHHEGSGAGRSVHLHLRSLAHQHEGRLLPVLRRPGHPADPDLHQVGSRETTGIIDRRRGEHSSPRPLPPRHRIRLPSRRRDAIPDQTAPLGRASCSSPSRS